MSDKKKNTKSKKSVSNLKVGHAKKNVHPESHEWYRAEFMEAEIKEGKYGDYIMLKFELQDGELQDGSSAKGANQFAFADAELPANSEATDMVAGIIGKGLEEADDVDLSSHYGNIYKVFVTVERIKTGPQKGEERSKITKIKPIKKKSSKTSSKKKSTNLKKKKK